MRAAPYNLTGPVFAPRLADLFLACSDLITAC